MTVTELIQALSQQPGDYEVEVLAHDGYVADCPRGTWFDAPIEQVELNDDVWPLKVRIVVQS